MKTLWHKIWADFLGDKSRSLLAIINVAAGVFTVGALFGMIDLQLSKMDAAHQLSHPSHISMILRSDADLAMLPQIAALPDVAGLDTLTQLTVRFRQIGESEWRMATLIIRPDYLNQHYDLSTLKTGDWPSAGHIAIENLSAEFSSLNIGESLEFATSQGNKTFTISGVVRHPFVKPPKFGGQLHFFADSSSTLAFGIKTNSFRQLLAQVESPYSKQQARIVAANIRQLFNQHQIAVNVTLLQDPEKHWGRPFLAGVNSVLQIMAVAALALASLLILNTISSRIAEQTHQIGIMKALGGSTIHIAAVYFGEVLLMALAAIMLALPVSVAVAYFSSCKILSLFNIDCGGFDFSGRALLFMVLGGLCTPLLAALGPVLRGARMTVREALASYGLGMDFGYSRLDLQIEQLGASILPTLYAAAFGNFFRLKQRLLLTQSVLVIAGIMFLVLMSLIASLNLTLDNEMARTRYAARLGFTSDQPNQLIKQLVNSVAESNHVEFWRRLPIELATAGKAIVQQGSLGTQLLAVPAEGKLYQPLVESGRWLQTDDAGKQVLLLSADTAKLNGIKIGDWLDVTLGTHQQSWQVIGFYRWLAGNNYAVEPVYAPVESLRDIGLHADLASFALLDTPISDLASESTYMQQLKQRFQEHDIALDVYTTQAKFEQRQFTRQQFNSVLGTLFGLASMIASVGGIGLSGALAIGVLQRSREIGVLRAIGAPSQAIFRLFQFEGVLHGLVAWTLTVPLAYLVAEPLAQELGKTMLGIALDFAFDVYAVFYWLAIILLIATIASYWPARKAANLSIRECLGR